MEKKKGGAEVPDAKRRHKRVPAESRGSRGGCERYDARDWDLSDGKSLSYPKGTTPSLPLCARSPVRTRRSRRRIEM